LQPRPYSAYLNGSQKRIKMMLKLNEMNRLKKQISAQVTKPATPV